MSEPGLSVVAAAVSEPDPARDEALRVLFDCARIDGHCAAMTQPIARSQSPP
jgi:hypothetical protein